MPHFASPILKALSENNPASVWPQNGRHQALVRPGLSVVAPWHLSIMYFDDQGIYNFTVHIDHHGYEYDWARYCWRHYQRAR